jgi:hypothetical protein
LPLVSFQMGSRANFAQADLRLQSCCLCLTSSRLLILIYWFWW